ncbi:mammalian cell entry protein [Mycobacterium florentinum]|uniref:Mammalian cell entry protein n=1 Tax=Mycobacterium florentinum TaxID=292462 RepID=A0A1X1U9V6_MYCFL|nr:MCE family protein [Mycobacterium florentinum]MCV7408192.1 MCE family protein [Mycobacterium florentinum]ORV53603.1 mammalian cell entry protein [Mycobacterium florentinum]BBX78599.1 Mce family protein Mce3B [Mycobacterium florentinum]
MRGNLTGLLLRLATFVVVCGIGAFALVAIYGQLRFENEKSYNAIFTTVSGLQNGNFVRIAGVEVGKVKNIQISGDATVRVTFSADDSVVLTQGTRAVIRYADLIGGRYLALEDGPGPTAKLPPGGTIKVANTAPALDLDALIGGFRPLFRALDPTQVNTLTSQLIAAFQGQGATIGSILAQTAALTNTLADRDELIGQVVVNLNTVLGSLAGHSDKFATAVDSLSELMHALAERKQDLVNSVAYGNAAAGSIADLLSQARAPLQKTVHETDRTAGNVEADHDYFDDFLKTLPDAYRVLGRQALNGDFFSFYMCDLIFKVNGKGGQPVFIKVAGQDTGRCTPR